MEVTRTNFQEVLEELDYVLKDAAFLSIDGEFTGLNSGSEARAFDTPAQYYSKLRSGSMDFLLVQFGLSVFNYDKNANKYIQRSYNFYVFPRPLNRAAPDCRFMCQASSISFLANQGFDFNKLFKLGIPYLTTDDEEKLTKKLEDRQKAREEGLDLIPISDDDRPQVEEICTRIEEFINSDAEELTIDKCNAFIRRLIHQETRIRWPNKVRVESKTDCVGQCLVIQRIGTKEEEQQREAEKREMEKQEVKEAVGLTALLRKIADSGILIVGHNMLLDLCHIIHQFFAPLPESYKEFKALVHALFPRLLDTKVICQSQQFKEIVPSSNLQVLLEIMMKKPFTIPEVESIKGRSYSTLNEKCHEAGYDAYITGLCFIALYQYLGSLQKSEVSTVLYDSPLLNPFLNKLLIARLKDFPYINLVGKDPNPSRDHVFHITFPKDWKHSDLSQLFSPFGGVYVSWISDTTAYVGLHRRDQANIVLRSLNKTSVYKIQKYSEHQASLEVNNTGLGERKRKLFPSEIDSQSKEENSSGTKDEDVPQENGSWEVATGNDNRLWAKSINPSSYPQDQSITSLEQGGLKEKTAETFLKQLKCPQKVSLGNTLSLSNDFTSKDEEQPKYAITGRSTVMELKQSTNSKRVGKVADKHSERMRHSEKYYNETESTAYEGKSLKADAAKKEWKSGKDKLINIDIRSDRLIKSNFMIMEKPKQMEEFSVSRSPKRTGKTTRSPAASPRSKRSPKKNLRVMATESGVVSSSFERDFTSEQNLRTYATVRGATDRGNAEINACMVYASEGPGEKVGLRQPTSKLQKNVKKRTENTWTTKNGIVLRLTLLAVLISIVYVFVVNGSLEYVRIQRKKHPSEQNQRVA